MPEKEIADRLKTHALRLKPGDDLKKEIQHYVLKKNVQAGWIACCVGSLTQYHLRFANKNEGTARNGFYEIVGAVGTVSVHGSHIHIIVSDGEGKTAGGHLLEGNLVYTTAEIIIQESTEYLFRRIQDGSTPWPELEIKRQEGS